MVVWLHFGVDAPIFLTVGWGPWTKDLKLRAMLTLELEAPWPILYILCDWLRSRGRSTFTL